MEIYDKFAAKKNGKTFYLAGEELKNKNSLDNLTEKDVLIVLGIPDNLKEIKGCPAYKKFLILPVGTDGGKYLKKSIETRRFDSTKVPEKETKFLKKVTEEAVQDADLFYLSVGMTKAMNDKYEEVEITSNGLFDEVSSGPQFIGPKLVMSCEDAVFELINAGYWVITEWDTKFAGKGLREVN